MVQAWRCVTTSPDRLRSIQGAELSRLPCVQFIMAQFFQDQIYEFRVQMKSEDCVSVVRKALVDHGFRDQDIITSLPKKTVFVPTTKTVLEVLHIIRLTGIPVVYVGFHQKMVQVTHVKMRLNQS